MTPLLTSDALTGLPGPEAFADTAQSVAAAVGGTATCWLLLVDVDDFRSLNSRYGHLAGDSYLRQLAHALRSALPQDRPLARVGGDEFGVLLADASLVGARDAADDLVTAAGGVPGDSVSSVSVGVAPWLPSVEAWERALARAELAVDSAKRLGGGRVHVFGIDDDTGAD